MLGAELVELNEAARALGVSTDMLQGRLETGQLPEAVATDERWTVPIEALAAIADREGWSLDLTSSQDPAAMPDQLERYMSETLAAHAAVVLAKTQATAARAEVEQMGRKLRRAADDLDAERAERHRAASELDEVQTINAELDRDRAVAEARTEEIRQQLAFERAQRSYLAQRIGTLEREREDLHAALGWVGRRRLRRSRQVMPTPMIGGPTVRPQQAI